MMHTIDADTCALRWLLTRGHETLTCDINVNPGDGFEVGVFPHQDPSHSIVTRFARFVPALERHATIVRELSDAGWVVTYRLPVSASLAAA